MNIIVTDQSVQIDLEDIKYYIQGLSVCTKPDGYKTVIFTAGPNKGKFLCRIILGCPQDLEIDHIDGNTLNNQRSNLRFATSQQNKFNRNTSLDSKGVIKHGSGWRAVITHNYKRIYLGTFCTKQAALIAYKNKAEELFGEFAIHNSRKSE